MMVVMDMMSVTLRRENEREGCEEVIEGRFGGGGWRGSCTVEDIWRDSY